MRYPILAVWLGVSLAAQGQPKCTGISLDVDARCSCIKDPTSKTCELLKMGLYDGTLKQSPLVWATTPNVGSSSVSTPSSTAARRPAQTAPKQARVVPLAHQDYLRFLQPNATLAIGFDLGKSSGAPDLVQAVLGQAGGDGGPLAAGLKEVDHFYMSVAAPDDIVILMTGKFETGAMAGMFYAKGVYPVFLGNAHAMIVGAEPALQTALARLAKPLAPNPGWVASHAREVSRTHEVWMAGEARPGNNPIRRFALGIGMAGGGEMTGEIVADSPAEAKKIADWGAGLSQGSASDAASFTLEGSTLRFAAKGGGWVAGDAGKQAMNSDLGAELYSAIMSGFPGMPARVVTEEKLSAVQAGMKREDILNLLGAPISVTAIQGLETPRETWVYQTPFGKQLTLRLDGGVATGPAR